MEKKTVYMDFGTLLSLSKISITAKLNIDEYKALKNLWNLYNEEKIRLVTSGNEMKMDIIMWLNSQGCCVTDTLTPLEAIKEFERWDRVDKNTVREWRRIFYYYDRIEFIPERYHDTSLMKELSEILHEDKVEPYCSSFDLNKVKDILRVCADNFGNIYSDDKWQDLSAIDYPLNWTIFELAMGKLRLEAELHDEDSKKIFGLLNRLINLSKKSSKTPRLNPDHIDFVLNTVINKYFSQKTSHIKHILICIFHNIEYMLTTDKKFIEDFRKKRQQHTDKFQSFCKKFDIMTPCEFQSKLIEK